jgi:hypothetical protein
MREFEAPTPERSLSVVAPAAELALSGASLDERDALALEPAPVADVFLS